MLQSHVLKIEQQTNNYRTTIEQLSNINNKGIKIKGYIYLCAFQRIEIDEIFNFLIYFVYTSLQSMYFGWRGSGFATLNSRKLQ
jgi:hypothetical protein